MLVSGVSLVLVLVARTHEAVFVVSGLRHAAANSQPDGLQHTLLEGVTATRSPPPCLSYMQQIPSRFDLISVLSDACLLYLKRDTNVLVP